MKRRAFIRLMGGAAAAWLSRGVVGPGVVATLCADNDLQKGAGH